MEKITGRLGNVPNADFTGIAKQPRTRNCYLTAVQKIRN